MNATTDWKSLVKRPRGIFIIEENPFGMAYGQDERTAIESIVDMVSPPKTRAQIAADPALLRDVELIFSSWGMPLVDEAFLAKAPNLKVIFYAAGSISSFATQAMWERDVQVTTATAANSVPVAEYSLATILFSLKHGWRLSRETREKRAFVPKQNMPGCFKRVVGLVSLGEIGKLVASRLKGFDLRVQAYDPYISREVAAEFDVELVELDEIFKSSDVVSLHTPMIHETKGMITGDHFASMKPGATFINTSRGAIVREEEMLDVLAQRPDLQAILDVCDPQPPRPDSRIFTLPNVVLTPHVAGSIGQECERMGRYMVEELERWLHGKPLKWAVTYESAQRTAHLPDVKATVNTDALRSRKPAKVT